MKNIKILKNKIRGLKSGINGFLSAFLCGKNNWQDCAGNIINKYNINNNYFDEKMVDRRLLDN